MNAKEYVEQMIVAIKNEDYEEYLNLLTAFEEDMDNVSDVEYNRLEQCAENVIGFWLSPQGHTSEIITALRWYLE